MAELPRGRPLVPSLERRFSSGPFDAAQLFATAKAERARRKAAWDRAGKGATDAARHDDALWSNVEQAAGLAAGDPVCLSRQPFAYFAPARKAMARNVWATAIKAETSLDIAVPAQRATIVGLWQLYQWLRPEGWSPHVKEEAA